MCKEVKHLVLGPDRAYSSRASFFSSVNGILAVAALRWGTERKEPSAEEFGARQSSSNPISASNSRSVRSIPKAG